MSLSAGLQNDIQSTLMKETYKTEMEKEENWVIK
jgi:hypothetical protein